MRLTPQKIMCTIDFSEFTDMSLSYCKGLADQFNSDIVLCHVVPGTFMTASHIPPYADFAGLEARSMKDAESKLDAKSGEFGLKSRNIVRSGYPAEEIAKAVRENDVDLVISATYGRSGMKRFLIGSVTDRLVKILNVPIIILNPAVQDISFKDRQGFKLEKIMVGVDFSENSHIALDVAAEFAGQFKSGLYLAHVARPAEFSGEGVSEIAGMHGAGFPVWNMTDYSMFSQEDGGGGGKRSKEDLFEQLETQLKKIVPEKSREWCTPVVSILEGTPSSEIIAYAEEKKIDLIVLGVHGHSLFDQFLVGSTTDRVIRRAPCPVLAVRIPEEKQTADKKTDASEDTSAVTAGDIMESDVVTVSPETDIVTAAKVLLRHQFNGVPVVDDEKRLIGILCQSDLIFQQKKVSLPSFFSLLDGIIPLSSSKQLDEEIKKIAATNVEQAMVKEVVSVGPEAKISEIASLMVENHFHTIPVVENGKLVGIIGKEDILNELIPF